MISASTTLMLSDFDFTNSPSNVACKCGCHGSILVYLKAFEVPISYVLLCLAAFGNSNRITGVLVVSSKVSICDKKSAALEQQV